MKLVPVDLTFCKYKRVHNYTLGVDTLFDFLDMPATTVRVDGFEKYYLNSQTCRSALKRIAERLNLAVEVFERRGKVYLTKTAEIIGGRYEDAIEI